MLPPARPRTRARIWSNGLHLDGFRAVLQGLRQLAERDIAVGDKDDRLALPLPVGRHGCGGVAGRNARHPRHAERHCPRRPHVMPLSERP